MKTTVELSDPLLARAKKHAQRTGKPLRALIEEGLRLVLDQKSAGPRYVLPDRSVGIPGGENPLDALSWQDLRDEILRRAVTMLAVDTNVLVYAHRREVSEHVVATELLKRLSEGDDRWAIAWPCLFEFFSVVTNPRIWKDRVSTPGQASDQIEAWVASSSLVLLSETEDFWFTLRDLAKRPRVRGPTIHDARIAALCLAHGVESLLTRDRDFSLFPELSVENPFAARKPRTPR